ncbi:MAG: S41 family peptidase [Rikenellaceae bacterium]
MKRKLLFIPLVLLALLSIHASKRDFTLVRDTEILINMMRALNEHYVDSLSSNQLLKDATNGMSKSLDPYTTYIDEEQMADFEIMTTGKYGGIGAVIRQDNDYVIVAQPYKGSPSDKSGLLIGDKILSIEDEDGKGMTTKDVSDRLKGTPGSSVKIVVSSVIDSTEREVTIRRERISIPAIPYAGMVNDSVAYLNHSDFTEGGFEQMRSELKRLESQGMRSLILDYRSNGGGIMQEAIKVLSLFVPKGSEVLKIKGRRDSTIYRTTNEPLYPNMPIVTLIDGNSASAAEIVVGAMQDMDRAVLIGQRSFGKGLVQSTVPIGFDSYLKLTTARYYIPSGRCIQEMDYSDHSDNREVGKMADSLRNEFLTVGGRKVYDGGGITPDIKFDAEYVSRFAATLYAEGHIEKWGENYYRKHHREPIDLDTFDLTDEDFEDFKALVSDRKINYKSHTSRAITALEKAAEEDRNEELMEELKRLKEGLKDDTKSNLERYKREIMNYMRQDYVLRRGYAEGVIRNSLKRDSTVLRALDLLNSEGQIEQILTVSVTDDSNEVK